MANEAYNLSTALPAFYHGRVSNDDYAALEFYLLDRLQDVGASAVIKELLGIVDSGFKHEACDYAHTHRVVSERYPSSIVIDLYETKEFVSVNVSLGTLAVAEPEQHPHHVWFYGVWENIQHVTNPAAVRKLPEPDRTVYLLAYLEAELMNGGLGQYLTNSEGKLINNTLECANIVGAEATVTLLKAAKKLKTKGLRYIDLWDAKAAAIEQLTDDYMHDVDDYPALTRQYFKSD